MRTVEPLRTPGYVAMVLGLDVETAARLMSSQRIVSRDIARPEAKRRRWRTTDSAIVAFLSTPEPEPTPEPTRKYGVLRQGPKRATSECETGTPRDTRRRYPVGMKVEEYLAITR